MRITRNKRRAQATYTVHRKTTRTAHHTTGIIRMHRANPAAAAGNPTCKTVAGVDVSWELTADKKIKVTTSTRTYLQYPQRVHPRTLSSPNVL
jgi:hypothetical protein